jgi:phage gp29-like protein
MNSATLACRVQARHRPSFSERSALAAASKERSAVRLYLVQADSDLLSETLIAWLCEFNGIGAVNVYRQVKEEEDLKASAETDAIIAGMGFDLSEDAVRMKYGEGWTKREDAQKPATQQDEAPVPAFAESPARLITDDPAQTALDAAVADIPDPQLDAYMQDVIGAFIDAISDASNYEDALARAAAALPDIPTERLANFLNNAMFDAELYGRLAPEAGP